MTINGRAARSMRDLRTRLRDVAAAEAGEATAKSAAAADEVTAEHELLEDTLDEAIDALGTVTHVYQLDDIGGMVASQRAAIVEAQKLHSAANEIAELATARLRARVRELKTAERVVELIDRDRAIRDARGEQRGHDDLTSRRR